MKMYYIALWTDSTLRVAYRLSPFTEDYADRYVERHGFDEYLSNIGGKVAVPRPTLTCKCGSAWPADKGILLDIKREYYLVVME